MEHKICVRPQSGSDETQCAIVGAGPAGLTAAYELAEAGVRPLVFEQDAVVGGIARTVEKAGYRFDIGGHRFFSKLQLIEDWWEKILGEDFLTCSRSSRIYYNNTFFDYPLRPINAITGLGPLEALRVAISYMGSQIFPCANENNFEQWVCNRFGRRLYEIFFKTYTEKVWGMKCSEISADWAAQRIKNLDFKAALKNMFLGNKKNDITSLIAQFRYPRLGPGMMWERVAQILANRGFPVRVAHKVTKLHVAKRRILGLTLMNGEGNEIHVEASHLISSMPIKDLVAALDPAPPAYVAEAAQKLRYRDFLIVGLIVDKAHVFRDNWIYVHSSKVKVGRIQNFKNWSPDMVADRSKSSLGLEYFVQKDDELWRAEDQELIGLARQECAELGLIKDEDVIDGLVIRVPNAYPVYDPSYKKSLSTIRSYLEAIPNLQLVGRAGQHRYNNQDHSMLTGIYAARNVCGQNVDVWNVNVEPEYHERGRPEARTGWIGERLVPQSIECDSRATLQSVAR